MMEHSVTIIVKVLCTLEKVTGSEAVLSYNEETRCAQLLRLVVDCASDLASQSLRSDLCIEFLKGGDTGLGP